MLLDPTTQRGVCIINHIKDTEFPHKPHMIMRHPLPLAHLLSRLSMAEITHLVEDSEIMDAQDLNPLKVRSLWELAVVLACQKPLAVVPLIKAKSSIMANKLVSRVVGMI